ncbi:flagellar biosynthetic protein FliR [Pseudomonas cichorii]|uniref:flagellar biosynthetic protein FliR n=1 Tax=Pseudomonas cichorii TaxID=36746 RepID=UPI001C8A27DD|nr:flagellar biosynthetic protein FliR [Pseudomonas cichorii]MBX8532918.1 flagellar biosynthetic protein FliR [Pseudomonas cichorii]
MLTSFFLNALLVSVRLIPLIVVSPILFFSRIPLTVRLLLALMLSAVLASGMTMADAPVFTLPVLLGELLLGVLMAFGFHAAHAGVDMAGKLIDTQIGLNAAGVFDPGTSSMTGLTAELLAWSLGALFLVLNLHHDLLRVFAQLLVAVPPGSVSLSALSMPLATVMTQQFLLAFMIVVPVILGLWLVDVAFAFLSRSMPQANVYFLSLPVKLGIGMFIFILTLPMIVQRLPLLIENALRFALSSVGTQ